MIEAQEAHEGAHDEGFSIDSSCCIFCNDCGALCRLRTPL